MDSGANFAGDTLTSQITSHVGITGKKVCIGFFFPYVPFE